MLRRSSQGVAACASRYRDFLDNRLAGRGVDTNIAVLEAAHPGITVLLADWLGINVRELDRSFVLRSHPSVRLDHGEIARVRRWRMGALSTQDLLSQNEYISVFTGEDEPVRYAHLRACLEVRSNSTADQQFPAAIALIQWYDDVADLDPALSDSRDRLQQLLIGQRNELSDGRTLLDRSYLTGTAPALGGFEIIKILSIVAREHFLEDPMMAGNYYVMDTRHY